MKPYLKPVDTKNVPALTKDGEVYTAEKRVQIVPKTEEEFFFAYACFTGFINDTKSLTDIKVLNWITRNLDYNHNTVTLNKYYKEKIVEYTGLAYSSVERSIGVLVDASILVRDNSCPRCGIYEVNPSYVWRGDRDVRKGKLKYVLELQQYNNLPELEQERADDIKRYEEWYNKNKS
jgi:hypothetical protein